MRTVVVIILVKEEEHVWEKDLENLLRLPAVLVVLIINIVVVVVVGNLALAIYYTIYS